MISFYSILESGHSRVKTDLILSEISKDTARVAELMDCFFSDEMRICQRASWAVGILGDKQASLLVPYFKRMMENLAYPKHDAIVRNTLRTWREMDIPEDYEGDVYEVCFAYLEDINKPIAIRAFAMHIVSNIAMKYPELINELLPVIEYHFPHGSAGFQSRAKLEMKRLRKKLPM